MGGAEEYAATGATIASARPMAATGGVDVDLEPSPETPLRVAFGVELERSGGKTRLCITPGDEVYWNVARPAGPLDETSAREAIRALDIGTGDDEAVSTALAQARRIARNRLSEARSAFAHRALRELRADKLRLRRDA